MLSNLGLELVVGFGSLGVKIVDFSLVVLDLSGLGGDDSLHDGPSGVEVSLKSGFELDSLGVAFSEILIVGRDVSIAGLLEFVVGGVGFLLLSDVPVLQIVKGAHEGVQWVTGLELEVDGVEQGLSESGGVDPVDESDVIIFSCPDCGNH